MKKIVSTVLLLIFLSGCTLSLEQQTVTQAALTGAIGGTALGAVLGKLIDNDPALGAIIGGIVGTIAGASYGSHIANKREEFRTQEAYLDACLMEIQKIYTRTAEYEAYLKGELQNVNHTTKEQLFLYNKGQLKKSMLTNDQQQIQIVLEIVVKQMERAADEVLIQQEVIKREKQIEQQNQGRLTALENQIQQLEQQLAMLYEDIRVLLK